VDDPNNRTQKLGVAIFFFLGAFLSESFPAENLIPFSEHFLKNPDKFDAGGSFGRGWVRTNRGGVWEWERRRDGV